MITEGILNINKPQNMTSHDVVSVMRRTLGIKKIGHTGTLDPMATGVLPICIGRSTRIMEYLDLDMKQYRCTMVLGVVTDTQDVWGQTLERFPSRRGESQSRLRRVSRRHRPEAADVFGAEGERQEVI